MLYPQNFISDLKNRIDFVRVIVALGFLLVSTMRGIAQDKPKATLVDQFGRIACDDFLARVDNFFTRINAHPGSKGYFVIKGDKELLVRKLAYELLFESAIQQRAYDRARAVIVRGDEHGSFEIVMWIVPTGGAASDFGETRWDLRMSPTQPPMDLRSDMAQICEPGPIDKVATDLIDANPDGSIFVVVHGPTARKRSLELRAARKMLSKFDSSRIRYLLRRSTYPYSDYYFAVGNPERTAFKSYF